MKKIIFTDNILLIHTKKIIFTDNILLISTFTDPYEEDNIY
jgi:hypothetical protein